jgi:hypothetical protein
VPERVFSGETLLFIRPSSLVRGINERAHSWRAGAAVPG